MSVMLCSECNGETKIVDVFATEEGYEVYRRRKCQSCGRLMYSLETEIEMTGINAELYGFYVKEGEKE